MAFSIKSRTEVLWFAACQNIEHKVAQILSHWYVNENVRMFFNVKGGHTATTINLKRKKMLKFTFALKKFNTGEEVQQKLDVQPLIYLYKEKRKIEKACNTHLSAAEPKHWSFLFGGNREATSPDGSTCLTKSVVSAPAFFSLASSLQKNIFSSHFLKPLSSSSGSNYTPSLLRSDLKDKHLS